MRGVLLFCLGVIFLALLVAAEDPKEIKDEHDYKDLKWKKYVSYEELEKMCKESLKRVDSDEEEDVRLYYVPDMYISCMSLTREIPLFVLHLIEKPEIRSSSYDWASFNGISASTFESSWDRGHMSPNGDWPLGTKIKTFNVINRVPQNKWYNQRYWASVEGAVRELLRLKDNKYRTPLLIITWVKRSALTALYKGGRGKAEVPEELWKAVYTVDSDDHKLKEMICASLINPKISDPEKLEKPHVYESDCKFKLKGLPGPTSTGTLYEDYLGLLFEGGTKDGRVKKYSGWGHTVEMSLVPKDDKLRVTMVTAPLCKSKMHFSMIDPPALELSWKLGISSSSDGDSSNDDLVRVQFKDLDTAISGHRSTAELERCELAFKMYLIIRCNHNSIPDNLAYLSPGTNDVPQLRLKRKASHLSDPEPATKAIKTSVTTRSMVAQSVPEEKKFKFRCMDGDVDNIEVKVEGHKFGHPLFYCNEVFQAIRDDDITTVTFYVDADCNTKKFDRGIKTALEYAVQHMGTLNR